MSAAGKRRLPSDSTTTGDSNISGASLEEESGVKSKQQKKKNFLRRAKRVKETVEKDMPAGGKIKDHFPLLKKSGKENSTSSTMDSEEREVDNVSEETQVSPLDMWRKLCEIGKDLKTVKREVEVMSGVIHELKVENEELRRDLTKCKNDLEETKDRVTEAKKEAEVARKRAEDLEQYGRRQNVRIYGIPEREGERETSEQIEEKVLKIFKDKLKLRDVNPSHICTIHRLGKPGVRPRRSRDSNDGKESDKSDKPPPPRAVIVRFVSRKTSRAVMANRKKLKGSGMAIQEDLTQARHSLLTKCLDLKGQGIDEAWSHEGKILVKIGKNIEEVKTVKDVIQLKSRD